MNQKEFIKTGLYLIDDVKERAEKGSRYFFSKETRRFFSSRISELCWIKNQDIFFITSESDSSSNTSNQRMYTIRKCDILGKIETIGNFQEFLTISQARKSLKNVIDE